MFGKTLFEVRILAGKLYSRMDILSPPAEEEWDIVEVKSSSGVKDVHIDLIESFDGDFITRLPSFLFLQTEV